MTDKQSAPDLSAKRLAPSRRIEVRANHDGPGFLLVAVTVRPESGKVETALSANPFMSKAFAEIVAESTARCVEQATGIMYGYAAEYVGRTRMDTATMNKSGAQ